MEEQINKIIKNGKKEKIEGIVCLIIFGLFTTLIALISVFVHEIVALLVILIVIDLSFIFMIIDGNSRIKNPQKYIQNTNANKNDKKSIVAFTSYKSKWVWDDATKEYLQLIGKDNIDDLSEEENDKIYEYASMPAVYFFMWLIDNELMSEGFYQAHKEEQISKLKKHEISPVDFFVYDMDCSLIRDDIDSKILPFVDNYFENDNKGYINFNSLELSDYYQCVINNKEFIFCVDFSWDIYNKIVDKINNAYNNFKE